MYLGVCKKDITPQIGGHLYGYDNFLLSESVHDKLSVTAFYLEKEDTRIMLISATVCLISTALSDEIREAVSSKTKLPKGNIVLSATHTHSGPNVSGETGWGEIDREYCDTIFIPEILESATTALSEKQKVTVGIASGKSLVGVNRREFTNDNRITFGQCPWGCFNPKMTVISFKNEKMDTVANIIHYGAHGTAAGYSREISRDWSGIMMDALESVTGGITAYFNGPEGDVGPRLSNGETTGGGNMSYVHELGEKAAEDAIRIYRKIKSYEEPSLECRECTVKLPLDKRIDLQTAMEKLSEYSKETVNINGQKAKHYRDIVSSYENNFTDETELSLPQTVIRIGSTAIATFPFEVFSEIGMRIEKMSQFENVLSFAITNGSYGYFVTEDQVCLGGYEVDMYKTARIQAFAKHADWSMVKETVRNLGGI